jgi:hypothetical protein
MNDVVKIKDDHGRVYIGKWATVSGPLRWYPRHKGKPHDWEMIETNWRECECGASQVIAFRPDTKKSK